MCLVDRTEDQDAVLRRGDGMLRVTYLARDPGLSSRRKKSSPSNL